MGAPVVGLFENEADWPFALRGDLLHECLDFLTSRRRGPHLLRICGPSGSGKSFLVREMMTRIANWSEWDVGLYVDVPAGEFEAAALLDRFDTLLAVERGSTRDRPSFVSKEVAKDWRSAHGDRSSRTVQYGYGASRELTGQIPVAGPFVKALLPTSVPSRIQSDADAGALRFLMKHSRRHGVLVVLDNVQFLPYAMRELLDREFSDAGQGLRLVLIERVYESPRIDWKPPLPDGPVLDVSLGAASPGEVAKLVALVLPGERDLQQVTDAVVRHSDGNLKSVWFQLRLLAARRAHQQLIASSYEGVFLALPALDQAVLRFIVFTVGGLTMSSLASLLHATDLTVQTEDVASSVNDLAALGLLSVDADAAQRISVEHELVSQMVNEATPEEEKLELRTQLIQALGRVLADDRSLSSAEKDLLYDRFLGIVSGAELRQVPFHMVLVVDFVRAQASIERHLYLAGLCRDSVCWDVLDLLPSATIRSLLDAIQKASLFSFGLVASSRLQQPPGVHADVAALYEAKYLVQLFRYDEARHALARAPASAERRAVEFNIALNLMEDARAAEAALDVYGEGSNQVGVEDDFIVMRNSVHLFGVSDARDLVNAAIDGLAALGRRFGVATAINNRGIVELAGADVAVAQRDFETARQMLEGLGSPEVYQPLVNLSAIAAVAMDFGRARELLSAARDSVPHGLAQDSAMLRLNELVLDLAESRCMTNEGLARAEAIVEDARLTRDIRFIDTACCLVDLLRGSDVTNALTSRARDRMSTLWRSERVSLELLLPAQLGERKVELPYVLSPHWRY
jgi:hypothetical protein